MEDSGLALINMMERFVDERLKDMLQKENCCKCERCIEDMKAIALNKLPSRYVSSLNGELYLKLDSTIRQNSTDIMVAISAAIECVSNHPSHK